MSSTSISELVRRVEVVAARIEALIAEGERPLSFRRHNQGPVVVTQDTAKPGGWRVTLLDFAMEPVGHVEAKDFRGPLKAAWHAGGVLVEK